MRLALRTLFWLVLASAVVIGWGVEHQRASSRLAELRQQAGWFDLDEPRPEPSQDALQRRAKCEELRKLSDAELADGSTRFNEHAFGESIEFDELRLCEMARRGMVTELQAYYDQMMANPGWAFSFVNNQKLLIALRRAQHQPDPLKIHVQLEHDNPGNPSGAQILATVENVDVGKESIYWKHGGDYEGGRSGSWRVELTDGHGVKVPDANFTSRGPGGGVYGVGPIAFGQRESSPNWFDAHCYIQPPKPGKYQLQVIYGGSAREPDLTGLLLLKSDPIPVIVTRPDGQPGTISVYPLLALLGAAAVAMATAAIRQARRTSGQREPRRFLLSWGDIIPLLLTTALAIGWYCDSRRLDREIRRLQPDQDADWSLTLAE